MFCPKCGKEGKGLCAACFLEDNPLAFKNLELVLCKCGRYRYRGMWLEQIDDALEDLVKRNLVVPSELEIDHVKVASEKKKDRIDLEIWVEGRYGEEAFTEKLEGKIRVKMSSCPDCSKISASYYEAILQVRSKKRPDTLGVEIDPRQVSNVEKVRGGYDFYLMSTQYGKQLEREFADLGFKVGESSKIYGKKDGKDVYRLSISIKEPPFSAGDFLSDGKKTLKVERLGRNAKIKDLSTGKQKMVDSSKLWSLRRVGGPEDLRCGMITMVSPHEIQVLDLTTNETFELKKAGLDVEAGKEISFLKLNNRIYIP